MVLKAGNRILVVHRRLFEGDIARFFLGVVDAYEAGLARVTGFTFVREALEGKVLRKPEARTKILSLSSGTLIVYSLPDDLAIENVHIRAGDGKLVLTDGGSFDINLAEHTY